jgi:hypothetical protein
MSHVPRRDGAAAREDARRARFLGLATRAVEELQRQGRTASVLAEGFYAKVCLDRPGRPTRRVYFVQGGLDLQALTFNGKGELGTHYLPAAATAGALVDRILAFDAGLTRAEEGGR